MIHKWAPGNARNIVSNIAWINLCAFFFLGRRSIDCIQYLNSGSPINLRSSNNNKKKCNYQEIKPVGYRICYGRLQDIIVLCRVGSLYNKIPQTGLNNRHLFLAVRRLGGLPSGCLRGWVLVRALFLACRHRFIFTGEWAVFWMSRGIW